MSGPDGRPSALFGFAHAHVVQPPSRTPSPHSSPNSSARPRPTLDGRLHWASTETAPDHAGHIEGALAAGERAAQAVLAAPDAQLRPGNGQSPAHESVRG
ncbi:FAD-dependent oxidoreductase [Streptomyces sp. NPDC018693]|uniref:FAD-dependent oxidoreductase n=1 Tax=unclassified Streptomyces TaxID=2593676 RepID=UPI0037A3A441